MASLGGRDSGMPCYLMAARGCWLSTEDHLGENVSPMDTTHRWWVTRATSKQGQMEL